MLHSHIQALDCSDLFISWSKSWLPLPPSLFLGTDSSSASSPVRETPRSPPTGSSGESMDSVSVSSSDSSSPSDSEGLAPTHNSDSQQNKVGYYTSKKWFGFWSYLGTVWELLWRGWELIIITYFFLLLFFSVSPFFFPSFLLKRKIATLTPKYLKIINQ